MAGDEAALGELYDEFSPLVYGLAVRVTRDWAAAQDTPLTRPVPPSPLARPVPGPDRQPRSNPAVARHRDPAGGGA